MFKIRQWELSVKVPGRGFHLITHKVLEKIEIADIEEGVLNIFLRHTSASLTINENVSPAVRLDMEEISSRLIPDNPHYHHSLEGEDDMPAHFKSSMFGVSLVIPITHGRLNLGIWQGIYLNEHRDKPSTRRLVLTAIGV
ncbi:MAG: secondary thiamine-phosphate synthase enzyme YjbQ [Campylobacterales bacterium]|jgi:secondary thiamine-phosphate synthase enzyme